MQHIDNHFETLGLPIGAAPRAVRTAYKRLARVAHPDRASGSTEAFQRLQAAYEALSDPAQHEACTVYWRNGGPRQLGTGAVLGANGWEIPRP